MKYQDEDRPWRFTSEDEPLAWWQVAVLFLIFAIIGFVLVFVLASDAAAHEWDRPRDLQPVEFVAPTLLPADAPDDAHVHWFLADLEWVNRGRHIPPRIPQRGVSTLQGRGTSLSAGTVAPGVEQWRGLVAAYFPAWAVDQALSVMQCESRGNPNATGAANDAGLFQFIPSTWAWVSAEIGRAGQSPYDPVANVHAASWLFNYGSGGRGPSWAHWTCKP